VDASHEKFGKLFMQTLKAELAKAGRGIDYIIVSGGGGGQPGSTQWGVGGWWLGARLCAETAGWDGNPSHVHFVLVTLLYCCAAPRISQARVYSCSSCAPPGPPTCSRPSSQAPQSGIRALLDVCCSLCRVAHIVPG
jgi:hypothetical protein